MVHTPTRWVLVVISVQRYTATIPSNSGKSTLIGVLSSSGLDDGRGAARSLVLRHRHEQENGRTSAVTMEIMGYGKDGQQVRTVVYRVLHSRVYHVVCHPE